MKNVFIAILCSCSTLSFAQNGFFLQPQVGGGFSNSVLYYPNMPDVNWATRNVPSWQAQLNIGYKAGQWRFTSGIGYLRTGVKLKNGTPANFDQYAFILYDMLPFGPYPLTAFDITDYSPHVIVPVKVGYELCRFGNRLSLVPAIGAELSYNRPRTILLGDYSEMKETPESFKNNCNRFGAIGVVELNMEYKLGQRYRIVAGPSFQFMALSELNFAQQHDYAVLMNLGLQYHFRKKLPGGGNPAPQLPAGGGIAYR